MKRQKIEGDQLLQIYESLPEVDAIDFKLPFVVVSQKKLAALLVD